MIVLQLMWEYFKIGLFAVGGGLATLPFIIEMAEKTGWITMSDISNMVAISESTPGPLGINMASYVGLITSGVLGAILATIAIVTPSIIVIIIIAKVLDKFKNSKAVKFIFNGLRPASVALISVACFSILKICLFKDASAISFGTGFMDNINFFAIILGIILVIFMKKVEKHPIASVLICAGIGIAYGMVIKLI